MGDPRRTRKTYDTPSHPWQAARIEEERGLTREYGLVNKTEIYKMTTTLKSFKDRAKTLLAQKTKQAEKEREQLIARMARLGLISPTASFDDILGLSIKNLMARRLQTVLIKKQLARTPKQARQMITHRHVLIGERVVTSPSYLVSVDEESQVRFAARSAFLNEQHPERYSQEELARKAQAHAEKQKAEEKKDEVLAFDEKAITEAEVLAGEKVKREDAA